MKKEFILSKKELKASPLTSAQREASANLLAETIFSNEYSDSEKSAGFAGWGLLENLTDAFNPDTIGDYEYKCRSLISFLTDPQDKLWGKDEAINMLMRLVDMFSGMNGGYFENYAMYYLLTNNSNSNTEEIKNYYYKNRAKRLACIDDYSKYAVLASSPGDAFGLIKNRLQK